jgi:pantetheine-phosphate adenylyltransferase
LKKPTKAAAGARIAIYTGSFDPMTLGHVDVIERAARLFDRLVVAVGEAQGKKTLFTVKERLQMIESVVKHVGNVTVASFSGLAVEFAKSQGAVAMIRGLRSTTDYAYEVQMALMNRVLDRGLETLFIPTSPDVSHISSSLAKEIAMHGGKVELLVPPLVAQRLADKVKG